MNVAPGSFIQACQIAQIDQDQAQKNWIEIWQKTLQDTIGQFIDQEDLDEQEMQKLQNVFQELLEKQHKQEGLIDTIVSSLNRDRQQKFLQILSQKFADHLETFNKNLKAKMTDEQRQEYTKFIKNKKL